LAELEPKLKASNIVFRDGTGSESGAHNVRYIPHMVIIDEDGKALETYDSGELGSLHGNSTLASTVHDKALSFKEKK